VRGAWRGRLPIPRDGARSQSHARHVFRANCRTPRPQSSARPRARFRRSSRLGERVARSPATSPTPKAQRL
jgi:hypothetical protein